MILIWLQGNRVREKRKILSAGVSSFSFFLRCSSGTAQSRGTENSSSTQRRGSSGSCDEPFRDFTAVTQIKYPGTILSHCTQHNSL